MVILKYYSFHVFFTYCLSQKITCQVFCNLMAHSLRTHDELISFFLFTAPTEKTSGNQSILYRTLLTPSRSSLPRPLFSSSACLIQAKQALNPTSIPKQGKSPNIRIRKHIDFCSSKATNNAGSGKRKNLFQSCY